MFRRAGTGLAFLATVLAALALAAAPARAAITLPPGFEEVTLADSFGAPGAGDPVDITWAPDGRMFIADRGGVVFVHNPGDPAGTNPVVLNISDHVNDPPMADRGLLGIATDSDFANNGYLYLLYTYDEPAPPGGPDSTNRKVSTLTRVTVHSDNSVDGGVNTPTEATILGSVHAVGTTVAGSCGAPSNAVDCIPSEGTSHTVGTVRSAPDGTLFVGTGDGNNFLTVDPLAFNDDNPATYRGKIMHIDRDGHGLPGHPFCPGNPLTDVCTKIYARGVRNPFRFTLRPDGGLAIGDVGQDAWEEVDLASGGEDFGWPCFEGHGHTTAGNNYSADPSCQAKYGSNAIITAPALALQHNHTACDPGVPTGNTVVGGPVYTGDQYPAGYRGQLFFGNVGGFGVPDCGYIGRANISGNSLTGYQVFATDWPGGVDLESAPDGNLAYVSLSDDAVREIVYDHRPSVSPSANPGAASFSVDFNAGGSDPDGDALTYDWDFGDGSPHGSGATPNHVYASAGTRVATVTVDDGRGMTASATVSATANPAAPIKSRARVHITHLRLSRGVAALAGEGLLAGSFSSENLVSKFDVSVWRGTAPASSTSCRWWSRRSRTLRRGSCKQPHWMLARLHRKGHKYAWSLKLGARLPLGSYTLVLQAVPHSNKLAPSARVGRHLRLP